MTSKSYAIALENENSGNYQEALNNYKIALGEVKKTKRNRDLRIKILEKIKVLHTVIDYHKGI
jgi:predicted RNase H-like HicB family nuclease